MNRAENAISIQEGRRVIRGLDVHSRPVPLDDVHAWVLSRFLKDERVDPSYKGIIVSMLSRTEELSYMRGLEDGVRLSMGEQLSNQGQIDARIESGNIVADMSEKGEIK